MQLQPGAYIVCLDIKLDDGTSMLEGLRLLELETGLRLGLGPKYLGQTYNSNTGEHHAVAWLPDFYLPSKPQCSGCLVDNDPRLGVIMVDSEDRQTKEKARAVFDALFSTAQSVMITSVWSIEKVKSQDVSSV